MLSLLLGLVIISTKSNMTEDPPPTVPGLIAHLKSNEFVSDFTVRNDAETLGKSAVDPLLHEINDGSPVVRAHVCVALGAIGDKRAVRPLIVCLKDSDTNVRSMAASSLGEIRDRRAVPALVESLKHDTGLVCLQVVYALGSIGGSRASDALIEQVEHRLPEATWAARALGRMRETKAIPALVGALGVGRTGWWGTEGIGAIDLGDNASEALSQIGKAGAPALIDALSSSEGWIRERAASALAPLNDLRAADDLWDMMQSDIALMARIRASMALAALKDRRATPLLLKWLSDPPDSGLTRHALIALKVSGDPRAVESVVPFVRSRDSDVREDAIQALARIRCKSSFRVLTELAADSDDFVRRAALSAIGTQRTPQALPILIRGLWSTSAQDRNAAANALAIYGDVCAVPALLRKVQMMSYDRDEVFHALASLGGPGRRATEDLALKASGELQRDAIMALEACRGRSLSTLRKLLTSPDFKVVSFAKTEIQLIEKGLRLTRGH